MLDHLASTEGIFLHDPVSTEASPDPSVLRFLATAARRCRVVKAAHAEWKMPMVLYPLGLVDKAGQWFLVADSERDRYVFSIAELRELTNTGQRFRRPDDFDLASFWKTYSVGT